MQQAQHLFIDQTGYQWAGKRVAVAGLARSGLAAARLLLLAGALPILWDQKNRDQLPGQEIDDLVRDGCQLLAGASPEQAIDGADALIVSPGIPQTAPIFSLASRVGLPIMGELEFASRFALGPIYAVTGTNGKTTTVALLGEIFRQAGQVVHVCGNIGYPLSAAVAQAKAEDIFVVEVSSFQLETIDTFRPRIAAVLNITPDHLNRHGDLAHYTALKRSIFGRQSPQDVALLNADDPLVAAMQEGLNSRVASFSRRAEGAEGAFAHQGMLMLRWAGTEQAICTQEEIGIPGAHNLENALAAAAMAGIAGVPPAVIRYALRSFAGVEHRMEFVRELDGIRYINDSKGTNPDATIKAVEAMRAPTILLAGGVDKQTPFAQLAHAIRRNSQIKHVILYGQTAEAIEQALRKTGFDAVRRAADLQGALAQGTALAQAGYTILLSPACASFDQFKDYEERGRYFKQMVSDLISGGEQHDGA